MGIDGFEEEKHDGPFSESITIFSHGAVAADTVEPITESKVLLKDWKRRK